MTKRTRPLVIAADPHRAFTSSTNNGDRFIAARKFVDDTVKARICSLHTSVHVDASTIPKIMLNRDTAETLKLELSNTVQCCNFPAFLKSTGAKDPDALMQRMIQTSIANIIKPYETYRRAKTSINAQRVAQFFKKNSLDYSAGEDLREVDTKTSFEPVSRRATLLPPIRPPVTRSSVSAKESNRKAAKLVPLTEGQDFDAVRSVTQSTVAARLVHLSDSEEDDLVDLEEDQPEDDGDDATMVSAKSEDSTQSVPRDQGSPAVKASLVQTSKSDKKPLYTQAQALLKRAIAEKFDIEIPEDSENYVFAAPTDEQVKNLLNLLKDNNQEFDRKVQTKLVKSHLLCPVNGSNKMFRNLYGVSFELQGNKLMDITRNKQYDVLYKTARQKVSGLGSVRYVVINSVIPPDVQ